MLHVHILLLNMLSDDLTLMLLILSNVKAAILTCRVTSLSVSKPKANTLKDNTPKANTPKANTPKANTPKANTPKANTPTANTPKTKTPKGLYCISCIDILSQACIRHKVNAQ